MNATKLNVLSLFDGVGAAYLALKRAGLEIGNYYSCEVDKSAIAVLNHHYSANTSFHQIGNVKNIKGQDYLDVDLVIFGFPCTQLSSVNPKDRSGLEGPDSSLFFHALKILAEIHQSKAKRHNLYFMVENVASMPNKDRDRITTELMGIFGNTVEIRKIDSAMVAPSRRIRYYWTNIPNIPPIQYSGMKFQDVIMNGYTDRPKANVLLSTHLTLTSGIYRYYKRNIGNVIYKYKEFADLTPEDKLLGYNDILKKSGYKGKAKSVNDEYDFPNGCYRLPSVLELERLMTFPDGYISKVPSISKTEKKRLIGQSFTVDVMTHLLKPLNNFLVIPYYKI